MFRRQRPDGIRVRDLPRLRRLMPHLMPRRSQALIQFEQRLDLSATDPWLARWNADPARPVLRLHQLIVAAGVRTLHEWPEMNRFVIGRQLWQRREIAISCSVLHRPGGGGAPGLSVVKQVHDPAEGLVATGARVARATEAGRSGGGSAERPLALLARLPGPLIAAALALERLADRWNLLPAALIRDDPLHASAMISNLGSIGLEACWHHLYDHGTVSIFLTFGPVAPMPFVTADGTLALRPGVTLRYSFDDRVADGRTAGASMARLKTLVEQPWLLLGPGESSPDAPAPPLATAPKAADPGRGSPHALDPCAIAGTAPCTPPAAPPPLSRRAETGSPGC